MEQAMYANEQFVGDNLVDAPDVEKIVRLVDMWKVVARPCRQEGQEAVYWRATTGGKEYGPYLRVDDLFVAVERDIDGENARAAKQYRFGRQTN